MISSRKRKLVVKKLNTFFERVGKVPTEAEYRTMGAVPFTLAQLQSYLGGYHRAVMFVQTYYPRWKPELPVVEKAGPRINLDALNEGEDE